MSKARRTANNNNNYNNYESFSKNRTNSMKSFNHSHTEPDSRNEPMLSRRPDGQHPSGDRIGRRAAANGRKPIASPSVHLRCRALWPTENHTNAPPRRIRTGQSLSDPLQWITYSFVAVRALVSYRTRAFKHVGAGASMQSTKI